MSSPVPSDSLFVSDSYERQWDPYDDSSQEPTQANKLKLCPFADWDSKRTYDEDPPSYIQYSIEWKVTVNNRAIMTKVTELGIVLAPADYWEHFLESKLEDFLYKENRPLRSKDTTVTVSVTARSERDFTKRFDDIDIEWTVIESQLVAWGELFRAGKKLRLNISFNYIATSQSTTTLQRRGHPSTTRQMLTERATQLGAEEASSGQPTIWEKVYNLMRCPGPPCSLGPHCWLDPNGKKHYRLLTHHLRSLIDYVEQGHTLLSHNDVPEDIRKQLYAEVQQSLERRQKATTTSTANSPPINITNVLPAHSCQTHMGAPPATTLVPDMPSISTPISCLDIPGFLDEAVEAYCAWQQSRVKKPILKVEYKKACDVIIEDGMDLELIHQDPNPEFLMKKGIKRGVAKHIVGDIDKWVKKNKQARTEE